MKGIKRPVFWVSMGLLLGMGFGLTFSVNANQKNSQIAAINFFEQAEENRQEAEYRKINKQGYHPYDRAQAIKPKVEIIKKCDYFSCAIFKKVSSLASEVSSFISNGAYKFISLQVLPEIAEFFQDLTNAGNQFVLETIPANISKIRNSLLAQSSETISPKKTFQLEFFLSPGGQLSDTAEFVPVVPDDSPVAVPPPSTAPAIQPTISDVIIREVQTRQITERLVVDDSRIEALEASLAALQQSQAQSSAELFQVISQSQQINSLGPQGSTPLTITSPTFSGTISGLDDDDIPNDITLSSSQVISTSNTGTSTFAGGLNVSALNITSTDATSTFANGIELTSGCFRLPDGNCAGIGGGSSSSGSGGAHWSTTTNDQVVYPTVTSNVVVVGSDATTSTDTIFEVIGTAYVSGNFGIGTTSPGTNLGIVGNSVFAGPVVAEDHIKTGYIIGTSSATSTFAGGVSTAGLSSSQGVTVTGGNILSSGRITVTDSATSTFTGDIKANLIHSDTQLVLAGLLNCDTLDTDGNGVVKCGSDTGGGANGWTDTGTIVRLETATDNVELSDLYIIGGNVEFGDGSATTSLTSAGGNFGIGTTTPGAGFSVAGTSTLFSGGVAIEGTTTASSLIATSTLGVGTTTPSDQSQFAVSGVSYFDGNLGIGTANPASPLQVLSSGGTLVTLTGAGGQARLDINAQGSNVDSQINFLLENSTQYALGVDDSDLDNFKISANPDLGQEVAFVITPVSNVGVGATSTIGNKLEVAGGGIFKGTLAVEDNLKTSYVIATSSSATSTFAGGLAVNTSGLVYDFSSGNVGIGTAAPDVKLDVVGGSVRIPNNNNYLSQDTSGTDRRIAQLTNGDILNIGPGGGISRTEIFGGGSGSIVINSSGNVGIGDTSPAQTLSVAGDSDFYGDLYITGSDINLGDGIATTTLTGLGGNLGIGTTSPGSGLVVAATSTLLDGILNVQDHIKTGSIIATGTLSVAGATTFNTVAYTWPSGDGAGGQFLQTNGAGVLSWETPAGGGGGGGAHWATTTNDLIVYPSVSSNIVVVGTNATATKGSIFEALGTAYISGGLGIGTTSAGGGFAMGITGTTSIFAGNVAIEGTTTASSLIATSTLGIGTSTISGDYQFGLTGNAYFNGGLSVGSDATTSPGDIRAGLLHSDTQLVLAGLLNCDTIDTDGNGVVKCGTDDGGGGTPAGASGSVQFNNAGSFGGSSVFQLLSSNVHLANDLFVSGGEINLGDGSATSTLTSASGLLGLSSTTPWGQFSVEAGTVADDLAPIFVVADTGTSTPFIHVNGIDGQVGIGSTTIGNDGIGFQVATSSLFGNDVTIVGNLDIQGSCVGCGGGGGAFTSSGGFTTMNTATDLLGVGTDTPGTKLSVEGGGVIKGNFSVEATSTASSLIATSTFGIGTSTISGDYQFGLTGNAYFNGGLSVGADATTSPGDIRAGLLHSDTQLVLAGLLNCDTIDTDGNGVVKCGSDDGGGGSPGGSDSQLQFNDASSFNGAAQLYWDDVNNFFGIGTTVPFAQVGIEAIQGVVGSTTPIFFVGDSGTSTPFLSVSGIDGNVGIGTTTAIAGLTISGNKSIFQTPGSSTPISGIDIADDGVTKLKVRGGYLYTGQSGSSEDCTLTDYKGCEFKIWSLSDIGSTTFIGGINTSSNGAVNDFDIEGDYAYVALSLGFDFAVYDISNPFQPYLVGELNLNSNPQEVEVQGDYAFVTTGLDGTACAGIGDDIVGCEFLVLDVSDPNNIIGVSGFSIKTAHSRLHVSGRYAYLGNAGSSGTCDDTEYGNCEILIVDISDVSSSTVVGYFDDPGQENINGIAVKGNYLYYAKGLDNGTCSTSDLTGCELSILDISDPTSPVALGGFELSRETTSIQNYGRYLYFTTEATAGACSEKDSSGCEILIFDITDPDIPEFVGGADSFGSTVNSIAISGNKIFAGKADGEATCKSNGEGCEVTIYETPGADFPSAEIANLQVGRLVAQREISLSGSLDAAGGIVAGTRGIMSQGRISVVGSSTDEDFVSAVFQGYVGIGTSTPKHPLTVTGEIFQTSATTTMIQAMEPTGQEINDVVVQGDRMYLVSDGNANVCDPIDKPHGCEFQIYDISTASTTWIGGAEIGDGGSDGETLFIAGNYAYVGKLSDTGTCSTSDPSGCEILVFDISNEKFPAQVAEIDQGISVFDLFVAEGRLFVAKANSSATCSGTDILGCEFAVYDVSDPNYIVPLNGYEGATEDANAVFIYGDFAFVGQNDGSQTDCSGSDINDCHLKIFDISDKASTTAVGGYHFSNNAAVESIYVSGSRAYIGRSNVTGDCIGNNHVGCELVVFDISNPASTTIVAGAPTDVVNEIVVQNHYMYLGLGELSGICDAPTTMTGCEFQVFDISVDKTPYDAIAGANTDGENILGMDVRGRRVYVGTSIDGSICDGSSFDGCEFAVLEMDGLDVTSADIGSLAVGNIQVRNDIEVSGFGTFLGEANFGEGLTSYDTLRVFASSTNNEVLSAIFGNRVSIGTSTPYSQLSLYGYGTSGNQLLEVTDGASSTVMMVLDSGEVGIGTSSPEGLLAIDNSGTKPSLLIRAGGSGDGLIAIAVDADDTCEDGSVAATCSLNDLAELFPTSGVLEAGDVVAFDAGNSSHLVKGDSSNHKGKLAGIISTSPAIVFEGSGLKALGGAYKPEDDKAPLTLSGRVPVKVNLEGGAIYIGDPITVSSVSGVARRATEAGQIIGYALQDFTEATTSPDTFDKIIVLADLAYWAPDSYSEDAPEDSVEQPSWFAQVIDVVGDWLRDAIIKIKELTVDQFRVGSKDKPSGITIYDQATGEPHCIIVDNGVMKNISGECAGINEVASDKEQETSGEGDIEPPVILINGNNPAVVDLHANYTDLGASVTDNVNENLGIKIFVNGEEVDLTIGVELDTSIVGEHAILYSATDQAGNTGEVTRIIQVVDPNAELETENNEQEANQEEIIPEPPQEPPTEEPEPESPSEEPSTEETFPEPPPLVDVDPIETGNPPAGETSTTTSQ